VKRIRNACLTGACLSSLLWSRPLLPRANLGTHAASFAGGGVAEASGVNALFVNPGALSLPVGHQMELGFMGFTGSVSPYFLYGSRTGNSNYALGGYVDSRNSTLEDARHGVLAGVALDALPWLTLGGAARGTGSGFIGGFGVDLDAGGSMRPSTWAVVGASARNLLESGVGQQPGGYRTRRDYTLAAGARAPSAAWWWVKLRDPSAHYEFEAGGILPFEFTHIFSLGTGLGSDGKVSVRATGRLPQGGTPTYALGIFMDLAMGGHGVDCGYAVDAADQSGAAWQAGASHSVSLNFQVAGRRDRTPPQVSVRADRLLLMPSGPQGAGLIHFRLWAADGREMSPSLEGPGLGDDPEAGLSQERGQLRDWELEIRATGPQGSVGEPVKTYQGRDLPPRLIRWEGRDESGRSLAQGLYAFRLAARDRVGNRGVTPWQLIEITSPYQPPAPEAPGENAPGFPADEFDP
jgi:hypothetical protein